MDVAVIGASGSVGRAVCMQLLATEVVGSGDRLQLVGRRGGASEVGIYGQRIDLMDAFAYRGPRIETVLDGGRIDADIVIVVAGATPPDQPDVIADRHTLAKVNLPIFEYYAQMLEEHGAKDELVIIQSNPVELAVSVFADRLGRHRVVGAGAYNDSLRFRRELADGLAGDRQAAPVVSAYILGEHGVNAVPIWSSARAAGMVPGDWEAHLDRVRHPTPLADLPGKVATTRQRLAELLIAKRPLEAEEYIAGCPPDIRALVKPWFAHWAGRTSMATAHSAVDVVAQLQSGHRSVLPLQVVVHADEWPGVDTVMGLPVDIDATGWHSVVPIPLTDDELTGLRAAGSAIADQLTRWRTPTSA